MATRGGEENVATLFGDVHYFYSAPNVQPCHHRFDKGSYVYLFENANERRCRIEIANQPGTDDQDAFDGFLDQTHMRYSYKQHCMVSLTVADTVNGNEWHLPTYDPRNENKYHYKLQSLDIYFWTQKDALQFVNGVRRVLPSSQVEVLDEPGPPPQPAGMSNVVQKLENVAISDPAYANENKPSSQPGAQGFPPPPPPVSAVTNGTNGSPAPATFAPMAYNPAAPAAPEAVQHREKTPPPDEDPLNPLAVAVAYDYQGQPFTPGLPSHFQPGMKSPGFPPGSARMGGFSQALGSPGPAPPHYGAQLQHPAIHRAATMPAGLPSPSLASPYGAGFPGSPGMPPPPPPPQAQHAVYGHPGQAPPSVTSPGLPQSTPGSYSNYTYAPHSGAPQGGMDYSIHHQGYQPTEAELGAHKQPQQPYQPKGEVRGRLEENAGRVERGVTGMLKKFEKKFG